jgi:hypothetical protein
LCFFPIEISDVRHTCKYTCFYIQYITKINKGYLPYSSRCYQACGARWKLRHLNFHTAGVSGMYPYNWLAQWRSELESVFLDFWWFCSFCKIYQHRLSKRYNHPPLLSISVEHGFNATDLNFKFNQMIKCIRS